MTTAANATESTIHALRRSDNGEGFQCDRCGEVATSEAIARARDARAFEHFVSDYHVAVQLLDDIPCEAKQAAQFVATNELEPIGPRVVVKQVDPTKKIGRIHVPDKAADKYRPGQGTVVAVPDEAALRSMRPMTSALAGESLCPVKVGDEVLYNKWEISDVTVNGEVFHVIPFEKILLRLKKPDEPQQQAVQ